MHGQFVLKQITRLKWCLCAMLVAAPSSIGAESPGDSPNLDRQVEEAAIRRAVAGREAALNARELEAFLRFHGPDIEFKDNAGKLLVAGIDALERAVHDRLEAVGKDLRSATFVDNVAFLTPTIALVHVDVRETARDRRQFTRVSRGSYILTKNDGNWRFRLHHHTPVVESTPDDATWLLSRELGRMPWTLSTRILPDSGSTPTEGDEQAVRNVFLEELEAMKRRDAEAMAAVYTVDGELKSTSGVHYARNHEQILHVRRFFAKHGINAGNTKVELPIDRVTFLRPRVALVHINGTQRSPLPPLIGSWIVIKEGDGKWRVRLQDNTWVAP